MPGDTFDYNVYTFLSSRHLWCVQLNLCLSTTDDEAQPNIMAAFQKMKPKAAVTPKAAAPAVKSPARSTPVNAADFFGGGPVIRVDTKLTSNKRKISVSQ